MTGTWFRTLGDRKMGRIKIPANPDLIDYGH